MDKKKVTKVQIAKDLGLCRQSLYYTSKQEGKDEILRDEILKVLQKHPSYGYRRLALALGVYKKRVQRVKHKYKILPYKRRVRMQKRLDLRR